MVGKFLLGMVSGGLLVAGGLIIGSAVAPMRPANDNAPVVEAAAEKPIEAPAATKADAGSAVDPLPTAQAEATATEATAAAEAPEPDAEPEAEIAPESAAVSAAEDLPDSPPDVAGAEGGPTAPAAEAAALAEPAAPALTEVAAPEAAPAPAKPAEAVADAAASPPEPAVPAPAEDTLLADAGPAAAAPEVDPEPEAPAEPVPVDTKPAAQPDVEAAETETAAPEAAEAAPEVTAKPTPEPVPEAEPALVPTPEAEPAPLAEVVPAEPAPAEAATPEPEPEPDVAPPVAESLPEPADPESGTVTMPGTQPKTMPGTPDTPAVIAPDAAEAPTPGTTFTPAPGLLGDGEGLIIGRGTEAAPVDPAADPDAAAADSRPIARFAAAFENPDAKPPLALVLVDRGQPDLDRASLAALPFPVSFALDPLDPATPERAAIYRAAGQEVVMLATGIAEGAQASDVEVAFQSMEQGLPEAVAVMDLADPAFQNNRGLASAIVPILKAQGRGLLTWDEGLNAADQVARREDLEAAVVFRDLGSAGADRAAVRRLLDRAVFKAGQDGQVAVVGEADPDTVAALLEWSVEGKAATVALAPLTAVLKID